MKIIARKDFMMDDGERAFTRNKAYPINSILGIGDTLHINTINDQGGAHGLPDSDFVYFNFKGEIREAKETCICAAIKATDGSIIRGQRHADAIGTCMEKGKDPDIGNGYDGFVTSTGRFVDRFEGYQLQVAAGIESIARGGYRGIRLFSEDLY